MDQNVLLACFAFTAFIATTLTLSDNYGRGYVFDSAPLTGAEAALIVYILGTIISLVVWQVWPQVSLTEFGHFVGANTVGAVLGACLGSFIAFQRNKSSGPARRFNFTIQN